MTADPLADFGREDRPPCRLYLISPPTLDLLDHAGALRAALAGGGSTAQPEACGNPAIAAYQLRMKGAADADVLAAAVLLQPICREADVAFILNDRMDLAKACGADGVHLGQGDGDPRAARALLGHDAQIGVTCHNSRHLAMEAGEAGASYVAFGAFFPTDTKAVEHHAGPDLLRWWTAISPIPCVAIGGITPANCRPLVEAQADFLAVSAAIWNEANPAAAILAFQDAMR